MLQSYEDIKLYLTPKERTLILFIKNTGIDNYFSSNIQDYKKEEKEIFNNLASAIIRERFVEFSQLFSSLSRKGIIFKVKRGNHRNYVYKLTSIGRKLIDINA